MLTDDLITTFSSAQAAFTERPPSMFDPPADVRADAPVIDRLVALTGRRPRPA